MSGASENAFYRSLLATLQPRMVEVNRRINFMGSRIEAIKDLSAIIAKMLIELNSYSNKEVSK